ncbi:MAG: hypothetical protein ACXV7D_15020 [Thermoanaerobaculia bacterium]
MRVLPWKPIAIVAIGAFLLLSLLLLPACCCVKGPAVPVAAPPTPPPPIGSAAMPSFAEAEVKGPTQAQMQNVAFHLDDATILDIHRLRGEMVSKAAGTPVNFDNKSSFVLRIDTAEIGMNAASLDSLLNRYVFSDRGGPLRNLHASVRGKQLVLEGIMHKIVDLPFTMTADVSASDGRIRIHPTRIDICGINGLAFLKALGQTLEKMIGKELPADHGVSAQANDMLLDPVKMLPSLTTEMKLAAARIEGDEMVQTLDAGRHLAPLDLQQPDEKNYMYYRGGTIRMGKLLMVDADMQVVDSDPSDAFDFYIDRYNEELVSGFSRNQTNYGLLVFMRDFADVGKPARPGERLPPAK